MYKKCAQVVEANQQNPVHAFPHVPQQAEMRHKHFQTIPDIRRLTHTNAHVINRSIHKAASEIISGEQRFYPISPVPTTTITIYN